MAPERSCFSTLNVLRAASLPTDMDYFTLTAQPTTKIWREPGLADTMTAPMIYTALREPLIVAEVTITANWEMEWDQAGLVIFAGTPPSAEDGHPYPPHSQAPCRRWVKAGLELSSGTLHLSSTTALSPSGADLSLNPLPNPTPCDNLYSPTPISVRIKFERLGDALWIWYQPPESPRHGTFRSPAEVSAGWRKAREVAGFFWGVERKDGVWIGCYASRPMQWNSSTTIQGQADDDRNGLWVEFEDLEIV